MICAEGWGGRGKGYRRHPLLQPTKPSVAGTFGGAALLLITWEPNIAQVEISWKHHIHRKSKVCWSFPLYKVITTFF